MTPVFQKDYLLEHQKRRGRRVVKASCPVRARSGHGLVHAVLLALSRSKIAREGDRAPAPIAWNVKPAIRPPRARP
jgi:hypothetical protein